MYKILIEKKVTKVLSRLNAKSYRIVSDSIKELASFREKKNLDVKHLKGKYDNMYRLRIGSRRVLFTLDEKAKQIKVWLIDNRGDIY